jgi:tetratricopeptide (TPR) repeat protein
LILVLLAEQQRLHQGTSPSAAAAKAEQLSVQQQQQQQQAMDEAEAYNAAGNEYYNQGDFVKASELYFGAVKVNGKVAKYRTNLCNALLKRGRPEEALEEAAAAIAVDGSWPKGHYFKALAYEEMCDLPKALAACEEGLRIHRYA